MNITTVAAPDTGREIEPDRDLRYYDFRALLQPEGHGDWLSRLETLIAQWLDSKHIPHGDQRPFTHEEEGVTLFLDRLDANGARAFQLSLEERREDTTWNTEVVAASAGEGLEWISVTGRNSHGEYVARPRFVRDLLGEIDVRDGTGELVSDTWVITLPHLQGFLDLLKDPTRHTPVFVATTAPGADVEPVRRLMERRTRDVAGLGRSLVLDAEATAVFNQGAGGSHGVHPGTIRSFAPGVRFRDPTDGARHRTVGQKRLATMGQDAIIALLGRFARFATATRREPAVILDARREFERRRFEDLLSAPRGRRRAPAPEPVTTTPADAPPVDEPPVGTPPIEIAPAETPPAETLPAETPAAETPPSPTPPAPVVDAPPEQAAPGGPPLPIQDHSTSRDELGALLDRLGVSGVEDALAAIDQMHGGVEEAGQQAAGIERAREEFARVSLERDALSQAWQEAEDRLDDLDQEASELRDQLRRARHEAREARRVLQEQRGIPAGPEDPEEPRCYSEVPEAIELYLGDFLVFTGNARTTEELEDYDRRGTSVAACWEGLLGLDGYARAVAAGRHTGGVAAYTTAPIEGFCPISPARHAAGESESTRKHRAYGKQRIFPVPPEVDPSGAVAMWAHLKLGQIGRVSPRLHYFDDMAGTGKIYIGYIGPHLGTVTG